MLSPVSVPKKEIGSKNYAGFMKPLSTILPDVPELISRGNRPLKLTFGYELIILINYHLWEYESVRDLIQHLKEDTFAEEHIAPPGGISRSSFCEAVNTRGFEQFQYVFRELCLLSGGLIPRQYAGFGDIVLIDGSLIPAVISMYWADYRKRSRKAKGHFGFNLNYGIPSAVYLTPGNGGERPFVSQILRPGQTGVTDRGYQSHKDFDTLQEEKKSFICRIKKNTKKHVIEEYPVRPDSFIFYDALVLLGNPGAKQTEKPVRVVGYHVGNATYFVATDRRDLTAEQIALIYKLRWDIEKFFQWWKKHLKLYHLIARTEYGVMVQILAGLIAYLLMVIYCRKNFNKPLSVGRIRHLRIIIRNELRQNFYEFLLWIFVKELIENFYART